VLAPRLSHSPLHHALIFLIYYFYLAWYFTFTATCTVSTAGVQYERATQQNSVACLDRFAGFLFTASLLARGGTAQRQSDRSSYSTAPTGPTRSRILRALQFEQKYRSKWRQVERASTDAATRLRDLHSFANRSRTSAAPSFFIAFGRYVLVAVLGLHTHTGEEFRAS
jgi:hypothetical protein